MIKLSKKSTLRKQILSVFTIFILVAQVSSLAFGQSTSNIVVDKNTGSWIRYGAKAPLFLYHWTSPENLGAIAGQKKMSDSIGPFNRKGSGATVLMYWPQLYSAIKENGLLFAWHDPVTGMKGGNMENYGTVILKLQVDTKNARVLELHSTEDFDSFMRADKNFSGNIDLSDVDIVYHQKGALKEWIVINPRVVIGFTADPNELRDEIQTGLKRLQNPNFLYNANDIHLVNFKEESKHSSVKELYLDYALRVLSELPLKRDVIPHYFLRKLGSSTRTCSQVFQF
jgi:hypothetical protein